MDPDHRNRPNLLNAWVLAFIAWCLLVLILSLMAHPPAIRLRWFTWDKALHAGAYALLTLLAAESFRLLAPTSRLVWPAAALYAFLFGITMEVLQFLTGNGRVAEVSDVVANAVGILVVCCLSGVARWFGSRRPNRRGTE